MITTNTFYYIILVSLFAACLSIRLFVVSALIGILH